MAVAHPIPDVPVRAYFGSDGSASFEVELDLRCFVEDPLNEPYLVNATLQAMDDAARAELMVPASAFFEKTATIIFDPLSPESVDPRFVAEFGKVGGGELKEAEDPVAVMLRWQAPLPEGVEAYRLEALETGELSVLFLNHLDGLAQKRMQVLFPGETSKQLNLTNIAADAKAGAAPAAGEDDEEDEKTVGENAADSAGAPAKGGNVVPASPEFDADKVAASNRSTLLMVGAVVIGAGAGVVWMVAKR